MGRQIQPDAWESKTHQAIYTTAQGFNSGVVTSNAKRFTDQAAALQEAIQVAGKKIQEIVGQQWRGQAALAVQTSYTKLFENLDAYGEKMLAFGNALPTVGFAMDTAKSKIEPPMSGETEKLGKTMGLSGEELSKKKAEDEAYARSQIVSLFSNQAVQTGNNTRDVDDTTPPGAGNALGNIQAHNAGSGIAALGGGGEKLQPPSGADGLASKDTRPQLAGGEGQQAGAGQGGGPGASSGGGQGSGSGGAGSGLLSGGGRDSGAGLPLGSTTAAGFSPSALGSGTGGVPGSGGPAAGLGGLRGGGLPGGAVGGTGPGGVNPAGVSAAGVRGVAGPMGMMGGAGAHGKGGKGEHDDEHAIPELLKNLDNSEEWLGERRTFIPGGVLGDFKAMEDAAKKDLEAEKRRFKSIGWDVKFSDEE